jgi:hypothetical protein
MDMRAGLASRGLLGSAEDGFPLTDAGHDHVDRLIAELIEAEAPDESTKPRVRWNTQRRRAA